MNSNKHLWCLTFFVWVTTILLMSGNASAGGIHSLKKLQDDSVAVQFRDGTQAKLGSITDWVKFTPSCTWTSNVTWTGLWRRVG